jgi:hypothetical protein
MRVCKDSGRTSQKTQCAYIEIETSKWMLFGEAIVVYWEDHMEPTNTV